MIVWNNLKNNNLLSQEFRKMIKKFSLLENYKITLQLLTLGVVAAANKGKSPPHDMMRLSASCEIMWVTLTT